MSKRRPLQNFGHSRVPTDPTYPAPFDDEWALAVCAAYVRKSCGRIAGRIFEDRCRASADYRACLFAVVGSVPHARYPGAAGAVDVYLSVGWEPVDGKIRARVVNLG